MVKPGVDSTHFAIDLKGDVVHVLEYLENQTRECELLRAVSIPDRLEQGAGEPPVFSR